MADDTPHRGPIDLRIANGEVLMIAYGDEVLTVDPQADNWPSYYEQRELVNKMLARLDLAALRFAADRAMRRSL